MISFREINTSDAEKILIWRTKNRVTKYMNTDIDFNIENQKKWIINLYNRKNYYYWIVQHNNIDVGVISLSDYNENKKITSWGFYIGEDDFIGIGAFVPLYFYNFVFKELKILKITAEIFYDNTNTIKLHMLHGYKFEPNSCRTITKNGKEILLIGMSLNVNDFLKKKKDKYISNFPLVKWNKND